MRAYVYIDGFNLFHGALRKTPYRWLDLHEMSKNILPDELEITKIKYFTARVSDTPDDPSISTRQDAYLRAIRKYLPNLEIYYGFFQRTKVEMPIANSNPAQTMIKVYKTEEKGSDVNLAVHLLNDAWHNYYECAVVISNDSDLAEAIYLVKKEHNKKIILVTPSTHGRGTSKKLRPLADHVRHIDKTSLAKSQLPNPIPNSNIHKPVNW